MRDKRGLLGFIFLAIVAMLPHLHAIAQANVQVAFVPAYGINPLSARTDITQRKVYVEIFNSNAWEACDVRVEARFYDTTNTLVGTSTASPLLDTVVANAKAPVILSATSYDRAFYPVARYSVVVVSATPCTTVRKPLTLLSAGLVNPFTGLEVSGVIRNDTALTLDRGRVVATFYRSDGGIWFAHYAAVIAKPLIADNPPWLLPPGGEGRYIVVTGAKDLVGLGYTIQAQAEPAASQWIAQ